MKLFKSLNGHGIGSVQKTVHYFITQLQKKDHNGRLVIYLNNFNKQTVKLKTILTEIGFFDFHTGNSGTKMVGVSQIIGYVYHSYKAYLRGYTISSTSHQYHHCDGNVTNNHHSNLVLLSTADHHIVTRIQNGLLDASQFTPSEDEVSSSFNNNGEPIKDRVRFLQFIIAKTLYLTSKWLEKTSSFTHRSKISSVKSVFTWIKQKLAPIKSWSSFFSTFHTLLPTIDTHLSDPQLDLGNWSFLPF